MRGNLEGTKIDPRVDLTEETETSQEGLTEGIEGGIRGMMPGRRICREFSSAILATLLM